MKEIDIREYKNPEIFGNEMVFNEEGFLVDTLMKINPVGKRLTITDDKIDNRKNIILLGDTLPDVNMA